MYYSSKPQAIAKLHHKLKCKSCIGVWQHTFENHLLFFSSVLTEEQVAAEEKEEQKDQPVLTIPTLGHQPVILGGLYSYAEDEFLPGKE